jgi:hypothetical protein
MLSLKRIIMLNYSCIMRIIFIFLQLYCNVHRYYIYVWQVQMQGHPWPSVLWSLTLALLSLIYVGVWIPLWHVRKLAFKCRGSMAKCSMIVDIGPFVPSLCEFKSRHWNVWKLAKIAYDRSAVLLRCLTLYTKVQLRLLKRDENSKFIYSALFIINEKRWQVLIQTCSFSARTATKRILLI